MKLIRHLSGPTCLYITKVSKIYKPILYTILHDFVLNNVVFHASCISHRKYIQRNTTKSTWTRTIPIQDILPTQCLEFVTFPQCLLVEKYWLPRLYHENRECVKTWTSLYCELKCTLRTSLWPRNFAPYPVSLRIQSWDQSSIKMYLGSLRLWNFRGNAYNKSSIRTNTVKYLSIPRCLIKAWEDRDCGSACSALRVPSSCKNEYQLNWLTNVPYAKRMRRNVTIQEAAQQNDLR